MSLVVPWGFGEDTGTVEVIVAKQIAVQVQPPYPTPISVKVEESNPKPIAVKVNPVQTPTIKVTVEPC